MMRVRPQDDMTTYPETYRYLCPGDDPWFWHWDIESEDLAADVVAWTDGSTIAFRPEIRAVLESLAPDGLPPFDAVVLLLAACRDSWELCRWQLMSVATETNDSDLVTLIEQLSIVNALPVSLRGSVEAKTILAGILFDGQLGRGRAADAKRILEGFDQFDPHASSRDVLVSSRDHFLRLQLRPLSGAELARLPDALPARADGTGPTAQGCEAGAARGRSGSQLAGGVGQGSRVAGTGSPDKKPDGCRIIASAGIGPR